MITNYLKVAWRNLTRYKIYSAINITGLATGLAVCMMIVLYVGHETSYDQFHKNADRIYWVQTKLKLGTDSVYLPYLNYSAAPMAMQREPAVESFLRLRRDEKNTVIANPENPAAKFSEPRFIFADNNFFSFFSFDLLQGNKEQVLNNPMNVVISRSAAAKYFGGASPVGKILRYNNSYDLLITGVAEDAPSNSTIRFDFVASISSMLAIQEQKEFITREKNDFTTYFLLKRGSQISQVESGLLKILNEKEKDSQFSARYVGTALPKIHQAATTDYSNLKYLKLFPFVAALVLLLALINYMNLSTARSSVRAKEIGVRKVMGASRSVIAKQFFIESALYTAIAFVLGYIICIIFQPLFFNFLQIPIDQSFLFDSRVILSFAGLFILTVVLSAAYPSLLLSAYKPVAVLYGKFKPGGNLNIRKFFTVFQFAIAVLFIIAGIVIQQQMNFFRTTDTGMKRDNIVMMPFGPGVTPHYTAFKNEIRSLAGVEELSTALHPMFKGYDMMGVIPPGGDQKMMLIATLDVDQRFISLLGLKWKIEPTDPHYYTNKNSIIVNETAVQKLNLAQPLHQKVDNFEVAGVLKDFNWSSLMGKIEPLFISVTKDEDSMSMWARKGGCVFAKINENTNLPGFMNQLQAIHKKYDGENPFEYYFMDEAFDALYKAEDRLARILIVFTGFAIVIACLGLFGLVTFMAVQRTKEIGIRKTLGASVRNIVKLLSVEFIVLVVLAVIIASPVAWYFMNNWLQDFAYRISIEWWVFPLAGLLAILIALFTISFQAIKAAMANPAKSLKTE